MNISPLTDDRLGDVLGYLRARPYRNALLLSNVSQLRGRCDVLLAEREGRVLGVASTYHDLPVPNLVFAAESAALTQELVAALIERNPGLREATIMGLLPEDRVRHLRQFAEIVGYEVEYQLGVEPETLRLPNGPAARRLNRADLPAMTALADTAGLEVWHERTLELGPAFGCFDGERLVAMAATHFATPEVIELGHIATHPDFRRRGYALACTAALARAAFALAPRVFLMVLEHNTAARAAYHRLGFYPIEAFYLTRFRCEL